MLAGSSLWQGLLLANPAVTPKGISPTVPGNYDNVTVTANVQPSAGTTISQVKLSYSTGTVTTSTAFRETMTATANAGWNGAGAQNAWTVTALRGGGDVRQRGTTANHTVPVVLSNCTTNGTATVTCASTTGLWPGMTISGTNIAAGTTITAVVDGATLTISPVATGSGSALTLTAAGVTLTNCTTTTASPNVTCDSTVGLVIGMGVTGTGLATNPGNPTVLSITDANHFVLSSSVTTGAGPLTLTASECGMEMSVGTSTYTDTMATMSSVINAGSASAGYVEFYVRTSNLISNNGWTLQISPDGGTTWNTRVSENYAGTTVPLTNCTLNATTTVTCASTSGLAAGMVVQGTTLSLANCATTITNPTVTCPNTTGLAVGMYVTGTGIPANSHVLSIIANTSFTLSANATATTPTGTTINTLANYLNGNTTVSSVSNDGITFVLSAAPFYSGGGLALNATTINHAFTLKHYNFTAADMTANMKMRFQFSGYTNVNPAPPPECDIDDIFVSLTTGVPPVTITMFDDGAHGDGAAGDGIYGAVIPVQAGGTTVTYTITATDSTNGSSTTGSSSYTVATVSPILAVIPTSGLTAIGPVGGPFTPASSSFTLSNTGTGSLNWTATNTTNWLTLSPSSGTLAAGANTTVTATLNPAANSLSGGSYSDVITFTNATDGAGTTTASVSLTVQTVPSAPVLNAQSTYTRGTTDTFSWTAVAGAASYTVQIATTPNFANPLATQTVSSPSASFINLTNGATYYYRVLAQNAAGTSTYSNVTSSTQDTTSPTVAITSPISGASTTVASITVTGTSSDTGSGLASVVVNNVPATTGNGFATWSATVPLGFGTNAIKATATDNAGNFTTTAPVLVTLTTAQTYNPLFIPDTMTGTTFNLTLDQSTKQYFTGAATATYGYNQSLFWGPTLIMKKGDFVQINLTNNLPATTTTHWHGFHIPAIMDGGPHETIPVGTTWSPSFYVKNRAATYWYHPHLHTTTQKQVTMGAGGLIIVQDDEEAALPLPRTYGVDDFPIVLTSRRFQNAPNGGPANQFVLNGAFGDYMLVNGTLNPQVSLPAQVVRLRILDAEIARNHNLGFSDNRTFYVIGTDGGLLNAPVPVTRMVMGVAERYEILVDLRNMTPGTSIDLMTFNSNQRAGYSGGQVGTTGANGSLLNNIDFVDLHINIVAATSQPITAIPTTLVNNVFWTTADVTNSRTVSLTGVGGAPLGFDNLVYSPSAVNQTVNYNAVEQWTLANVSNLDHTFHIHDIQFVLTSVPGGIPAYMQGWKDSFYSVQQGTSVSFIAKFDGFASNTNPFMFHCHFLQHEDGGLMGQFVVANQAAEEIVLSSFTRTGATTAIVLPFTATAGAVYAVEYAANLTSGIWTPVGLATSNGTSITFTETVTARLAQTGYYRVAIPLITIASFTRDTSDPTIHLQFQATAGTTYTVQYSPDMTTGSWVDVGSITSDGTSGDFYETECGAARD